MDVMSPGKRSALMSRIRSKDTKPERLVRQLAHKLGFRFRLHRRDLPGVPDLVFPSRRKVIFVHGCFWHQHPRCQFAYKPKSNRKFWENKLSTNRKRDDRVIRKLHKQGWDSLVIWECQTRNASALATMLTSHLNRLVRSGTRG